MTITFSSVQFSRSVMSDFLRPHESQHARPPCPSPTPGVHPDSHPLSQWCHPAISSSVVPFSPCPQSLPASESFPMSQLFAWGVSALASFLPKTLITNKLTKYVKQSKLSNKIFEEQQYFFRTIKGYLQCTKYAGISLTNMSSQHPQASSEYI